MKFMINFRNDLSLFNKHILKSNRKNRNKEVYKKKNQLQIILDVLKLLSVALFYYKRTVTMNFHEVGGLALCGIFLIHIGLNMPWVRGVAMRLFSKKLPLKTRIAFMINLLLLVCFFTIALSGVMISKTIFVSLTDHSFNWKMIHYFAAGMSIILLGIHLGLHLGYLKSLATKHMKPLNKVLKGILVVGIIFIICFGTYNIATSSLSNWLMMPFAQSSNFSGNEHGRSIPDKNALSEGGSSILNRERPMPNDRISLSGLVRQIVLINSMIAAFTAFTAGFERLFRKPKGIQINIL